MVDRAACYDVPAHHARLWGEHRQTAEHDVATLASFGDERVAGFGDAFLPETYHRLYAAAPNAIAPEKRGRAAAMRAKLHALAEELPEFSTLRARTVRDPLWAGMATQAIGDSVARALPERDDAPPDADRAERILRGLTKLQQGAGEAGEAAFGGDVARAQGAAAGAAFAVGEAADGVDESAVRQALRAGIAEANDAIDGAEQGMAALGYGSGIGGNGSRDPGVAVELARRVASSTKLRRIVALAGRLTLTARAKRASRTNYARSEVVGVEQTGSFARLLPSELVGLATPLTTAALYRKVTERAALGYRMAGKEREAKGPIVVLIDQSSSMASGGKDEWAKAIALAILDVARTERRAFGVILYDTRILASRLFVDPAAADPVAILDLLSTSPEGGTRYDDAVDRALGWIETSRGAAAVMRRADVIHLTDGAAPTDGAEAAKKRAEANGARLYGIGIGYRGAALAAWSDEVTAIDDVAADAQAVDLIFGEAI